MSVATIPHIEASVHTANVWLKELAQELGWDERERVYHALRSVLHALRNRLTVDEAADLGAQLPLLIRGLYYEAWDPSATPMKERRKEAFLHHIAVDFQNDPEVYPDGIASAVLKLLERHVSSGEIKDVLHVLHREIRALWPSGEGLHAAAAGL
jgi:uncharacterized protein (DUF2267 family)